MSQTPNDPAGTTHQFQNFAGQAPQQPAKAPGMNKGLIFGIVAVVAVIAIAAIAFMLM
ncbi:hypothetical protein [Actinomadura sp. WMMB 499]|uniref:hypothetical protein n=1 Tax=Actinomadura sp. WMMB 499 TaxID=1219491 RepID=UPI00159E5851|nr:hypothetical protein [Actinomadura sp. WMMB 499]